MTKSTKITQYVNLLVATGDYVSDGFRLYKWNGHVFEERRESFFIRDECGQEFFEFTGLTSWNLNNFVEIYKRLCHLTVNEFLDIVPDHWILFKNCIYDLRTGEIGEYNKEMYITATLPYEYIPDADPQLFNHRLRQVLPDDEDRNTFCWFMRYCLTPAISAQKALLVLGSGSNGKTKLIEFLVRLIGKRATTFDLSTMNSHEFYKSVSGIRGKYLAYSSEIGGDRLTREHLDRLKRLITNEFLKGRGAYKEEQEWVNTTKWVFDCNDLPKITYKKDNAFFRRFVILEFKQQFWFEDVVDNPYGDVMDEGPAILSWLCQQEFSEPRVDPAEVRRYWLKESDPVYEWLEIVDERQKEYVEERDVNWMFVSYSDFCERHEYRCDSFEWFQRRLGSFIPIYPNDSIVQQSPPDVIEEPEEPEELDYDEAM